jgi:adenylate cyclase
MEGVFCSFQTDRQGGFTDGELEFLRRLMPQLALTYKAIITVRTARALMTTYLGKDPGERVIAGSIDRGRAVSVPAVLWYSDLQGFTKIGDAVDGPVLLALLNDYAEAVVAAVQQHEGEVLKFIGDGVFAMFPGDGGGTETLCRRALDAAVSLRDAVDALNERRSQAELPTCGFYVALHYGEVLYGNIGSPARLDFTVVGPAVNEPRASRRCAGHWTNGSSSQRPSPKRQAPPEVGWSRSVAMHYAGFAAHKSFSPSIPKAERSGRLTAASSGGRPCGRTDGRAPY